MSTFSAILPPVDFTARAEVFLASCLYGRSGRQHMIRILKRGA